MLKFKQLMPGMLVSFSFAMVSSVEAATVNPSNGDPVMTITNLEICISSDVICAKTREELAQNEIQTIGFYNVEFLFGEFDQIFADPTAPGFVGSCDNGLCFWGNQGRANRAIESLKDIEGNSVNDTIGISEAMNDTNLVNPTPGFVFGEFIVPGNPPIPLPNNFYLVPISFDGNMTITSRKGDYDGLSWDLQNASETSDVNADDPLGNGLQSYARFAFTGMTRQVLPIPTEPPEPPPVPEPSGLMGILFTFGSMLIAIKKKN